MSRLNPRLAPALALLLCVLGPATASAQGGSVNLAVELGGPASDLGHVESSPPGIDCRPDCSASYPDGTTVTLTADPRGDATFTGWSGGGCSGTGPCEVTLVDDGGGGARRAITGSTTITASFDAPARTITVSRTGTGSGVVSSSPSGIDCGADCQGTFPHNANQDVVLRALPAQGSTFAGWSGGGCSGRASTCAVRPTANRAVTAAFEPAPIGAEPIVFSREEAGESDYDIWMMNPDGSSQVNLTARERDSLLEREPALSPDGSMVTGVQIDTTVDPGLAFPEPDVFVMNANGSGRRQLTNEVQVTGVLGGYSQPSFSPDGATIVAARETVSGGTICRKIVLVDVATGNETSPTGCIAGHPAVSSPSFTPDGSRIVYQESTRRPQEAGRVVIVSINLDGSERTELVASEDFTPETQLLQPAVSPDGSTLAFAAGDGGTEFGVYVMDLEGSFPLLVAPGGWAPSFSPDGTRIVYAIPNDGGIETVDTLGGNRVVVTDDTFRDEDPHWGSSAACEAIAEAPAGGRSARRAYYGSSNAPNMAKEPRSRGHAPPKIERVRPRSIVAGGSVALRGRGLAGDDLRAKVSGKRAKLFERRGRSATLGVPLGVERGRTTISVRRGAARASAKLRIARDFDGTIGAELESENAASETIGPGGGTLAATGSDGASYSLDVPPGALTTPEQVTMTPVARLVDSPFSGPSAGVELSPDGLDLDTPASLRISRQGGFPRGTTGFVMGEVLEVTRPAGNRGELVLSVEHFSTHGGAGLTEADAARTISGYLEDRKGRDLTRAEIRSLLTLVAYFDDRFFPPPTGELLGEEEIEDLPDKGSTFCSRTDVCAKAEAKARESVRKLISPACGRGLSNPSIDAIAEIRGMQAEFHLLGGEGLPFEGCIVDIANRLASRLISSVEATPLARVSPPKVRVRGSSADINRDGALSVFESGLLHAAAFQLLGFDGQGAFKGAEQLDIEIRAALERALTRILTSGRDACERSAAGRSAAIANLREGHAYAVRFGQLENDYLAALAACGIEVIITPATATVVPGEVMLFNATLTNEEDQEAGAVEWSASAGRIEGFPNENSLVGEFTAPDSEGAVEVRARSTLNSTRVGTARVTVVEGC